MQNPGHVPFAPYRPLRFEELQFLGIASSRVPHSWKKQLCYSRIGAASQRARCQNTAFQQPSHWLIEKFSRPPNPLGMQWRAFHGRVPCVGRYFVCVYEYNPRHMGRACAADTHIPAPLSSLTPIDPRTLTITRAFEFCVNRHQKVFYYPKLGTRVFRPLRPLTAVLFEELQFLGVASSKVIALLE